MRGLLICLGLVCILSVAWVSITILQSDTFLLFLMINLSLKKIIVFRGFLYLVDLIFYVYISLSTIFLLSYAIASNTGCFPLPTVLLSKFPVIQLYFNNQRTFLPQERENVQTSRNKVKFYKDPNIRNRFRQNLSV